jgi:hypothetical protein
LVAFPYICPQSNAQIYHTERANKKLRTIESIYFINFSLLNLMFIKNTIKNQNNAQNKEKS